MAQLRSLTTVLYLVRCEDHVIPHSRIPIMANIPPSSTQLDWVAFCLVASHPHWPPLWLPQPTLLDCLVKEVTPIYQAISHHSLLHP